MIRSSRVIVTIGNGQDLSSYAAQVGAEYRKLERRKDNPETELFRLNKYHGAYGGMMFVGNMPFRWTEDLFEYQSRMGGVIRHQFTLFVVDKFTPKIFAPVSEKVTPTEIRNLIDSRIYAGIKLDEGAGAELAEIFAWLGFPPCQRCARIARTMNMRGPVWCRENYDYLFSVIVGNVKANGITIGKQAKEGVRSMLTIAIERAEGTRTAKQQATLAAAKVYLAFKKF